MNVDLTTYNGVSRPLLSVYELSAVGTKLAETIYDNTSIAEYQTEKEINNIVNPAQLAFQLLQSGAYDAIIDRGYDKIKYSETHKNELKLTQLDNYFNEQNESVDTYILQRLGLVK